MTKDLQPSARRLDVTGLETRPLMTREGRPLTKEELRIRVGGLLLGPDGAPFRTRDGKLDSRDAVVVAPDGRPTDLKGKPIVTKNG
eukprot:NODE_13278_length_1175_cov_3.337786.p4 GENE.NODE_13278_length_1175_cov_3.337786~~NODE_13278_length_1175_cov_3.337786.p4  ORF type:complete len:86 (+),score=27.68 NODE_13278_length_1175_cov_3.337786:137-394(+)